MESKLHTITFLNLSLPIYFPYPNSFYAENIQKLYSLIIGYSIVIMVIILLFLTYLFIMYTNTYNIISYSAENWILEMLFIIFPFIIVLLLVYPSFSLLYSINEIHQIECLLKITGHQWFWSYEFTTL